MAFDFSRWLECAWPSVAIQGETGQNLLDHLGLTPLNEGDDAHRRTTLGTANWVRRVNLFDQGRPAFASLPGRGRAGGNPRCGRRRRSRQDIHLVGIAEPNQDLARRYAGAYQLSTNLFFTSLEEMLEKVRPQAVATFTSTFEHRRVVEVCAARGVHVMMEKPLAVSIEHARAMEAAASERLMRRKLSPRFHPLPRRIMTPFPTWPPWCAEKSDPAVFPLWKQT